MSQREISTRPPGGVVPAGGVFAPYGIEALEDDPELAAICEFACKLIDAPIAVVSLIDEERERVLAGTGRAERELPHADSLCARAAKFQGLIVSEDVQADSRFDPLPAGSDIRFYAGMPLISPEGHTLGALCVMDRVPRPGGLDAMQRQGMEVLAQAVMRRLGHRREGLAREKEMAVTLRRIGRMADGIPAITWTCSPKFEFDYFNGRWREFTGEDPPRDNEGWRAFLHPDDADEAMSHWAEMSEAGEPYESEYRMRHVSGEWRWVLSRAVPMQKRDGSIERWFGTVTDIDEQRALSEQSELLAHELSHRIKNIFAVIASLIALRGRQHPAGQAFAAELAEAIAALGRAHDYIRPSGGRHGHRLVGLLTDLLAPYLADGKERITFHGDDCRLGESAATPLALVFHELATNSAKYGALSRQEGRVTLTMHTDGEAGTIRINWLESGGPAPESQGSEGFGSRLIRMAVEGQLRGRIERHWLDDGVAVEVIVPLEALQR